MSIGISYNAFHIDSDIADQFAPNLSRYVAIRSQTTKDYFEKDPTVEQPAKLLILANERVRAKSTEDVQAGANAGNPEDCVELAVRIYSKCCATGTEEEAMEWALRATTKLFPTDPAERRSVAQAFAFCARLWWEWCIEDQVCNIDSLYRAASCANWAIYHGLFTFSMVLICRRINAIREQFPDAREVQDKPYDQLSHLWNAFARSEKAEKEANAKRVLKVAKAPNAYRCAAEGCGIEGTKKSALMRCSGKCPADLKPSYCSTECQKKDWRRHRPVCKAGGQLEASEQLTSEAPPVFTSSIKLSDPLGPQHFDNRGIERAVDIPGTDIKFKSSTLSPAFIRELRDHLGERKRGSKNV